MGAGARAAGLHHYLLQQAIVVEWRRARIYVDGSHAGFPVMAGNSDTINGCLEDTRIFPQDLGHFGGRHVLPFPPKSVSESGLELTTVTMLGINMLGLN
jgi:hypothetical protein